MRTVEEITDHLRDELLVAVETRTAKYNEAEWRTGVIGAMMESRIITLNELLEWIEA
jgi:hypothetical protein